MSKISLYIIALLGWLGTVVMVSAVVLKLVRF
jgi:hypothetical protein